MKSSELANREGEREGERAKEIQEGGPSSLLVKFFFEQEIQLAEEIQKLATDRITGQLVAAGRNQPVATRVSCKNLFNKTSAAVYGRRSIWGGCVQQEKKKKRRAKKSEQTKNLPPKLLSTWWCLP